MATRAVAGTGGRSLAGAAPPFSMPLSTERTMLAISFAFISISTKPPILKLIIDYTIRKESTMTHLLFLVKLLAEVRPSPVGPAMVKVQ